MMRLLVIFATLLLCVYSAPLQKSQRLSRVKRAAEQVIFGNHQNNARVKKSGPGLATPLQPLSPAAQEADLDKKALVASEVKSAEEHDQDVSQEQLESQQGESNEQDVGQEQEQSSKEESHEEGSKSHEPAEQSEEFNSVAEDLDEENLQQLLDQENAIATDEQMSEQPFPLDLNGKNLIDPNTLGSEYVDYPSYDYQYNPYLRRKRSLGQHKVAAVVAEDMMHGGPALAAGGRRSKRDLGQDLRYLLQDYDYPEIERRAEADSYFPNEIEEEEGLSKADMEELLREEMEQYQPEEEVEEEEAPVEQILGYNQRPEPEIDDFALINYLSRNGYGNLANDYEEEEANEVEPWQQMGPAPEVQLPEEVAPYISPYGQYDPAVMNAPYSLSKRQYLSFVPGNKRSSDFYPYSYGPDGRWGALVTGEVAEKRAEEEMYERLLRLAAALRDRRDELEAEQYYAGYPNK